MEDNNNKPDYKGFGEHLEEASSIGIPIDRQYLLDLSREYRTPVPGTAEWEKEFYPGWEKDIHNFTTE